MRKICQFIMIASVVILAGCSTFNKKNHAGAGAQVADVDSGVTASGVGTAESFGDSDKVGALQVGNQTYYFDFDKSEVRESDRPSVSVQARYLAAHPAAKIVLEGHTDPRGSHEYNIALGQRRALSMADMLKLEGAGNDQIRTVSYGAEKQASSGTTEDDYQRDRRVELKYEAKG